jgi:hypothetical protein
MGFMKARRTQRGQAVTEVALIAPLALLLVLGGYDLSVLASNKVLATSAVRHGARVAAELGGYGKLVPANSCNGTQATNVGTTDLLRTDQSIVSTVLAATSTMTYLGAGTAHPGKPDEIDIYQPSRTDGKFVPASDAYEQYLPSDNFATNHHAGTLYSLDKRCQGPLGGEADIGVRMTWTYRPANGIPGTVKFDDSPLPADWAVEKEMLCIENCLR